MKKILLVFLFGLFYIAGYASKTYTLDEVKEVTFRGVENVYNDETRTYSALRFDCFGVAIGEDATIRRRESKLFLSGSSVPYTKKQIYNTLNNACPQLAALYKDLHFNLISEDVTE